MRCLDGILEVRKLSREHGQAVYPKQPFGGRGPRDGRDEAIPPAQAPSQRHQPLADGERLPVIALCHADLL